jgi:5-methylcytosine-specific restriction endonuclease McrA
MAGRRSKPQASKRFRKKRRSAADRLEAKAKGMQQAWSRATGGSETLSLNEARKIIKAGVTCPYCLQPVPPLELSVDHVIPRSREGLSESANLVWCCKSCNILKGSLLDTEFKALRDLVASFGSSVAEESIWRRLKAGGIIFKRRGYWNY